MRKILIVDLDRSQRENYGNNLKKVGYEITYAQDGEAALSKVRQEWPDLILLEILLPKIDGLSVLKTLKEDEQTKNIPVLILTKEEAPDKRVEAAKLGVTIYFVKRETSFPVLENWVKELTGLGVEQKEEKEKSKNKILLVEDDPLMLKMYEKVFTFEGFDINTANDGEEGLLKAKRVNPSLIILDIMMPRLDGMDMLKKLKQDPNLKKIPVVVLTNLSGKEYAKEALSLGALKYIVKSDYEPRQVASMVKEILSS